ncbi:DHGL dehydrogenase, partial [Acromyrmex charruanus]
MLPIDMSVSPQCPMLGPSLAQSCPGTQYMIFMTLLDMLIQSQEKVSQTCERVRPKISPEYQYDFIVVGGE